MCCTTFLDIFIWYVIIGQTKYHLSTKDLKSIKLEYNNSIKILTGLGSLKQFKQMGQQSLKSKMQGEFAIDNMLYGLKGKI